MTVLLSHNLLGSYMRYLQCLVFSGTGRVVLENAVVMLITAQEEIMLRPNLKKSCALPVCLCLFILGINSWCIKRPEFGENKKRKEGLIEDLSNPWIDPWLLALKVHASGRLAKQNIQLIILPVCPVYLLSCMLQTFLHGMFPMTASLPSLPCVHSLPKTWPHQIHHYNNCKSV